MLTAHETLKEAWSKFKSYPRLRQIILFNFIAILPSVFLALMTETPEGTVPNNSYVAMDVGSNIISMIVSFLTGMSITHYVCTGWVFDNFSDFLRPPSSKWKLFWKSMLTYLIPFILCIIVFGGLGFVVSLLPMIAKIVFVPVLGALALGTIIYLTVKIMIVMPYFTMNDGASLLSLFHFSEGYFKYLMKIMGWVFLYAIPAIILLILFVALSEITILGTFGEALVTAIIQTLYIALSIFVYAEAYRQISIDKN